MITKNEDDIALQEDDFIVEDAGKLNFFMMPNSVLTWPGMTNAAFRLYAFYKMICGDSCNSRCYADIKMINDALSMSKHTVIAARQTLVDLGLITVRKTKKNGGGQLVLVTLVDVWRKNQDWVSPVCRKRTLRSAESALYGVQKAHFHINNIKLNNTKLKKSRPGGDRTHQKVDGFPLDGEDRKLTVFEKAANQLYDALAAKRKILRKPTLGKWAADLKKFFLDADLELDEFSRVLDWYAENIGKEFVPQAYSAKAFCEKYVRIASQMEMQSSTKQSKLTDQVMELLRNERK